MSTAVRDDRLANASPAEGDTQPPAEPALAAKGPTQPPTAGRLAGLLVLLALLLLGLAVTPVIGNRLALKAELARTRADVARAGALVAAAPRLAAAREDARRALQDSGLLLAGDSPARAAAQLQTRIRDLADDTDSELRQLQVHDAPVRESDLPAVLEPVEVEMELVTDIQGLHQILRALEGGPPLVVVRALHIRARLERADPQTGEYAVMPDLVVSMTVRGYHLKAESGGMEAEP